ncbi:unnamed protein product [Penicillium bialowiezense]
MPLTTSLKTDPLASDIVPISSAPVAGLDGAAEGSPDSMRSKSSPKREYRILELRESFGGFNVGRKCPRLELDATVDKYHSLDNLNEPADPQNTPISNSVRECTPDSLSYHIENVREAVNDLTSDFYQDRPVKSLFARRGDETERSERPGSGTHEHLANRSALRKPGNSGEARYVRFGAVHSPLSSPPLSPPRVKRRPLPSIERKRDYISTYRQKKQCDKWKIARRPTPRKRVSSRNSAFEAQILGALTSTQVRGCNRSLSSSPLSGPIHSSPQARCRPGKSAVDAIADDAPTASVVSNSTVAPDVQQDEEPLRVCFSIYSIQRRVELPAVKLPYWVYEFRTIETRIADIPKHLSLQFPPGCEYIIQPVTVEYLLFRATLIVPRKTMRLVLSLLSFMDRELKSTRAGIMVLSCLNMLLSLVTSVAALIFSLCGVALSYHQLSWNPD